MKKFFLTALGLVGLLLGSCQRDDYPGRETQSGSKALKLVLNIPDMGSGETRTTINAVTGEEEISTLHLFFFEPSSDRTGTYQGHLALTNPTMNMDIELSGLTSSLDARAAYRILAVANVDYSYLGNISENDWLARFDIGNTTEGSVFNSMLAYTRSGEQIESDNIIMTGQADKPADPLATIPLTLTRGLVRFDVVNSARAEYNLKSVSIWNAFPQTSMFGGGLIPYETTERIHEFYGVDNYFDGTIPGYPDIFGGLYAFPNQVISPEAKDQKTTCLIVGLSKNDGSGPETVTYHRVNIAAQDAMQNLKRNNVYRLTIRSVGGPGANSEIEAYAGGINNINYKINYWELDDDGLIQQNGNIILGIPTKLIRFGAEADERSYEVFAFGGTANEQISVTSTLDSGLEVSKVGNTITVKAEALTAAESERTGSIVVSYGGLTATIGIRQSGEIGKFLRVTTPSGAGLPPFPYYIDASASVEVAASGAWTAKIYQFGSPEYFAVSDGATWSNSMGSSELTKTVDLKTTDENNTLASRPAFVLFSLNDDPENYNSALVLTQQAKGSVWLTPNVNKVEWNSLGNLTTTGGVNTTDFKFMVETTVDASGQTPVFLEWKAELVNGTGFTIVDQKNDATEASQNYVIVKANGPTQGSQLDGQLKVSLKDNSASVDVNLHQEGYKLQLNPGAFSPISNDGGTTGAILISSSNVTDPSAFTWSAKIMNQTANLGGVSGTHTASFADPSSNATLNPDQKYPLTQRLAVTFPKLLYGNHRKGAITATIEITLWRGLAIADKHTFTVAQEGLEPKKLTIANYHGKDNSYNYGNLYSTSNHYSKAWRDFITTLFTKDGYDIAYPDQQVNPITRVYTTAEGVVLPTAATSVVPVPSTVNYVHASQANGLPRSDDQTGDRQGALESWRQADNGIMVVNNGSAGTTTSDWRLFWPLRSVGWKGAGTVNGSTAITIRRDTNSKITKFIYENGPFGAVIEDGSLTFSTNNTGQALDITGTKGVAIIGNDTKASLVIDPVNHIVFIGENRFFSTATGYADNVDLSLTSSRSKLLANVAAYAILTAQYGSHFSDLFID